MCTDVTSANGAEPQLRSSRNERDPKPVAIQVQQHVLAYSAPCATRSRTRWPRSAAEGGRVTPARRAVLEAILNVGEHHFTAAEISDAVESTDRRPDRATVYRTLDLLTELGVVTPLQLDSDAVVYHRTDHRHGHLVCDRCGAIVELPRTAVRAGAQGASRSGISRRHRPGHDHGSVRAMRFRSRPPSASSDRSVEVRQRAWCSLGQEAFAMSLARLLPAWLHAVADYAVGLALVVVALASGASAGAVGTGVVVGVTSFSSSACSPGTRSAS